MRQLTRLSFACAAALALFTFAPRPAAAAETLCDSSFQNCRSPLLTLIDNENVEIDVGFWFMEDQRYVSHIINRFNAGVKVRLIVDPRANPTYTLNKTSLDTFQSAGIPMIKKAGGGIMHFKTMIFAGQNVVEFGSANYSDNAFVPVAPYTNYVSETIFFEDDPAIVNSFKEKFDELWIDTTNYLVYANVTSRVRSYPTYTISADMNFPPGQSYANRVNGRIKNETQQVDVDMYRITQQSEGDAIIAAFQRGVPVRYMGETREYRLASRLWVAYNMDRIYAAGIPMRVRASDGENHEKLVLLYNQGMSVFGSSNWTSASDNSQQEHNYFTTKSWIFQWFQDQFNRKWNNSTGNVETTAFVPLPPDAPVYQTPANGATGIATTGTVLKWYGGPWAHVYDIYFGTSPTPPLFAGGQPLGPSQTTTQYQSFTLPTLQAGTTYFWQIRSKTMAGLYKNGPIYSFTTSGTAPTPTLPSGWSTSDVGAVGVQGSASESNGTFTVTGSGADIWGSADAFRYAYQQVSGDTTIVARVTGVQNVNAWTKAGVMIRQSLDAGSAHASMLVTPGKGIAFQRRLTAGGTSVSTGTSGTAPKWVKVSLSGSTVTASYSSDGSSWTQLGQDTIAFSGSLYVGLAVSSHDNTTTAVATFDSVSISASSPPPPPPSSPLPSGWSNSDVGTVGIAGSSSYSNGTFTIQGSGADIWGTADQFQYAYEQMTGDATIVARVASVQNIYAWTKAGVMIRQSLDPGSAHASMFVTPGKGLAYQRRLTAGATSVNTSVAGAAPEWVKVSLSGQTVTASVSSDGSTWTQVGQDTIAFSGSIYVGLAVCSHDNTKLATATFDNVTITASTTTTASLPTGWTDGDVGSVGVAGSASYNAGVFTVSGSGADIWNTADAFNYAHESLSGDGQLVARVASLGNTYKWAKAGVMIRETLAANSSYAMMLVSPGAGTAFQYRTSTGASAQSIAGTPDAAPWWVKIVRSGNTLSGYQSSDGSTWQLVGSTTIGMATDVNVGLAVSSHDNTKLTTATFDSVG